VIASLRQAGDAVFGDAGTVIVPDE